MTVLMSEPFQSAILAGLICCVAMGGHSEYLDALDLSQCWIIRDLPRTSFVGLKKHHFLF